MRGRHFARCDPPYFPLTLLPCVPSLPDSVVSSAYNLVNLYTATNTILEIVADGQAIWRSIGTDASADLVFQRAYISGGIQKIVRNHNIIK